MITFISGLQYKSSEVVELNIQSKSRGMSSPNITSTSNTSSYNTSYNISTESNQINPQKCSIVFMSDHNTHKITTSNETCIIVAIANIITSKNISFNIAQKPGFEKVLELAIMFLK